MRTFKVGQVAFQIVLIYNPTSMYETAAFCKVPQTKRNSFSKEISKYSEWYAPEFLDWKAEF